MRIFSLMILFYFSQAQAQECSQSEFKPLMICLSQQHIEFKKVEHLKSQSEGVRNSAPWFSNPEFSLETTRGKSLGDTIGTNRIQVAYPFEVFGQISSRKTKARAESTLLSLESQKIKMSLLSQTVVNFYRLRQIREEEKVLEQTLKAYQKVIGQLSSRPQLSPEHQVSLNTFKLAVQDLDFKRANLTREQREIEDFMSHISGLSKSLLEKSLPPKKTQWPTIQESKKIQLEGWPIKKVEAELQLAKANFEGSKSESWPEIKIGLIYDQEIEGAIEKSQYGIGLSMPIPLLNWNQGNRQATAAAYKNAIVDQELASKEVQNEHARLRELYLSAVDLSRKALSPKDVEKKYQNIESLYSRGLVGSSLLIESYRQFYDYIVSQNEIELRAMLSLFRIAELEGTPPEDYL